MWLAPVVGRLATGHGPERLMSFALPDILIAGSFIDQRNDPDRRESVLENRGTLGQMPQARRK